MSKGRVARRHLLVLVASLFGAVVLSACRDALPDDGPGKAFVVFVENVAAGRSEAAWGMLSEETRQTADRMAAVARKAQRGAGPRSGRELLFGHGRALARQLDTVEVVEQDASRATLRVTDREGTTRTVEMRLEGGAWRVHLPLR